MAGRSLDGPAIVELPATTIVVYPDWRLSLTDRGDFLLTRESNDGKELA